MINVITQTTEERENETVELFNKIKPLLDKGLTYTKAVKIVLGFRGSPSFVQRAWFRDLINYGETQGYPYGVYSGKGSVKKRKSHV